MIGTHIRGAWRSMRKAPAFTLAAALTLALGIGATTAIFGVVRAVLLRPLPFPEPERLVTLWQPNPPQGIDRDVVSYPNLVDWRADRQHLSNLGGHYPLGVATAGAGDPEQLEGAVVTSGFFDTIGVSPVLGRVFAEDEFSPGRETVAVLSHGVWRRKFGGDPALLGRTVHLNAVPHTIVGIMPPGFDYPAEVDVWLPLAPSGAFARLMDVRGAHWLSTVGRLAPGVAVPEAQRGLDVVARQLSQAYPDDNANLGILVEPLHEHVVGRVRPAIRLLMLIVAGVLLIACVNVANLLLAKSSDRQREMAIRTALGAGRRQVVGQLLTEAVLLSGAGGVLGVIFAYAGLGAIVRFGPPDLPRLHDVGLDPLVLAFTALVTLLTGLAFGLAPALHTSRVSVSDHLKGGNKGAPDIARGRRLRAVLVVAQVAAAIVLLAGAGLLVRSFGRLLAVHPGFDPDHVITARVSLPRVKYTRPEQARDLSLHLVERLRSMPGVKAAGVAGTIPLSRLPNSSSLSVAGRPAPAPGDPDVPVLFDSVTPGYFDVLGLRLLRGRFFTEGDAAESPRVVVINEELARLAFAGEDPLGKRVTFENPADPRSIWYEIVGVAGSIRRLTLDLDPSPEVLFPQAQQPVRSFTVVLKAGPDPSGYARLIQQEVWALDREQPVSQVRTLDELLDASLVSRRFLMALVGGFALLAMLLCAVGVYGVIAFSTSQRTREIGIRVALGAQPSDVRRLVLRQGLHLALAGIVLGLLAAAPVARLMGSLLYGVGPHDPVTLASISGILLAVAAVASYLPARRATRVSPCTALHLD